MGLAVMGHYQATPGPDGASPIQWPRESPIERDPSKFTLIMFAHPHCPCTRASIAELARIMTRTNGRIDCRVLFVQSETAAPEPEMTENWQASAEIPGVRVLYDSGGVSARLFGVRTSGQVVLYDPQGKLMFQGGITRARGHQGDNAGAEAVLAVMKGDSPSCRSAPVFGCALLDP